MAEQKQTRKRVGIFGMKAPARDGTEIFDAKGEAKIGTVSPSVSHCQPALPCSTRELFRAIYGVNDGILNDNGSDTLIFPVPSYLFS